MPEKDASILELSLSPSDDLAPCILIRGEVGGGRREEEASWSEAAAATATGSSVAEAREQEAARRAHVVVVHEARREDRKRGYGLQDAGISINVYIK